MEYIGRGLIGCRLLFLDDVNHILGFHINAIEVGCGVKCVVRVLVHNRVIVNRSQELVIVNSNLAGVSGVIRVYSVDAQTNATYRCGNVYNRVTSNTHILGGMALAGLLVGVTSMP